MRCWSCQEENRGARQYCRACGALLQLICQHCRTANDPGDLFCGGCGRGCAPPNATGACAAGVCVGAGALRVTLTWDVAGDMDLYVVTPSGAVINWSNAAGGIAPGWENTKMPSRKAISVGIEVI